MIERGKFARIKSAIIGTGYISRFHVDAIRRTGIADILAFYDKDYELAQKKAEEYSVPRCYKDLKDLLNDKEIDVIHNCTPNNLHFVISKKIIESKYFKSC